MNDRPVIIIRRKKKAAHGHHGGAWKIAFADFMTALMALFLVLWTLANAGQAQKAAVAEYFRTPLVVALMGGDREEPAGTSSPAAVPIRTSPRASTFASTRNWSRDGSTSRSAHACSSWKGASSRH
ncbi:flagellar motor protein MotB [Azotobacter chroococcum]